MPAAGEMKEELTSMEGTQGSFLQRCCDLALHHHLLKHPGRTWKFGVARYTYQGRKGSIYFKWQLLASLRVAAVKLIECRSHIAFCLVWIIQVSPSHQQTVSLMLSCLLCIILAHTVMLSLSSFLLSLRGYKKGALEGDTQSLNIPATSRSCRKKHYPLSIQLLSNWSEEMSNKPRLEAHAFLFCKHLREENIGAEIAFLSFSCCCTFLSHVFHPWQARSPVTGETPIFIIQLRFPRT